MRTIGFVMLTLALGPAGALAQNRIEQRRPATADGVVRIENPFGSVKVTGWSREEVLVTGTLYGDADSLQVTGSAQRTRIEVQGGWSAGRSTGEREEAEHAERHAVGPGAAKNRAELEVKAPAGSRIEIESFAGSVMVENVSGRVRAETVQGSISVTGKPSEVEVETVNGSIEVEAPAERVRAEAVNGGVTIRGARGEVAASSVAGRLEVAGEAFRRVKLESVSGQTRFDGSLASGATVEVESVSGSVELRLPADASAEFRVTTHTGGFSSDFEAPAPRREDRYSPEKEVTFTTGTGDAKVRVQTLAGSVSVRKR